MSQPAFEIDKRCERFAGLGNPDSPQNLATGIALLEVAQAGKDPEHHDDLVANWDIAFA